jgi:hypothetical protein
MLHSFSRSLIENRLRGYFMKIIVVAGLQEKLDPGLSPEDIDEEEMDTIVDKPILRKIDKLIEREIAPKLADYSNEPESYRILNSRAYIALRLNLSDFIGNAYDAGATYIIFIFRENSIDLFGTATKIIITLSDNGKGIPDNMLLKIGEEKNSYGKNVKDLLGDKIKFESDKKDPTQHGCSGIGVARSVIFLDKLNGNIYFSRNPVGQGAKIVFESDPGIDDPQSRLSLSSQFGKDKSQQVKKVETPVIITYFSDDEDNEEISKTPLQIIFPDSEKEEDSEEIQTPLPLADSISPSTTILSQSSSELDSPFVSSPISSKSQDEEHYLFQDSEGDECPEKTQTPLPLDDFIFPSTNIESSRNIHSLFVNSPVSLPQNRENFVFQEQEHHRINKL